MKQKGIAQELANSPLHQQRIQAEKELMEKNVHDMTVADRLMLRTYDQRIIVPLEDKNGTIDIEMRMWTRNELDTLDKSLGLVDTDTKEGALARDNVYGLLGGMCIDESLSREFWEKGNWGLAVFMEMRAGIIEAISQTVIDSRAFRGK